MTTLTHNELMGRWMLVDPVKNHVFEYDIEKKEATGLIFADGSVNKGWHNCLAASQTMYKELTLQYEMLENMIEVCEGMKGTRFLIEKFTAMQNSILLAQRVALVGVKKVAAEVSAKNGRK